MSETKQNKTSIRIIIGILGVWLLGSGITNSSPAMEYIAQAFPDVSYSVISLVATIPNLLMVICSLVGGAIADKKISSRSLLIVSGILYCIGGMSSAVLDSNIYLILFSRVLFGIGIGLATPLALSSSYIYIHDDAESQKVAGWGATVQNVNAMAGVVIAGYLCMIQWNYTFLVYAIGLIGLIAVFIGIPKVDTKIKVDNTAGTDSVKRKSSMPKAVYWYVAIIMFYMMLAYPIYVNMSPLIVQAGLGDATTVGNILVFFNVGGIVAGLVNGYLYKRFKYAMIPFILFLAAVSLGVIGITSSVLVITAATLFAGSTAAFIMPCIMAKVHSMIKAEDVSMASGLIMAGLNMGGFVVSGYYVILEKLGLTAPSDVFKISAVLLACLGIAAIILNKKYKNEK